MVLSGSCERVDEIRITESVDCSTYESAGTQTAMGFSQDPDTPGLAENVRRESEVFAESAAMMADAIGAKLDRMTFDVTFTAATGDSDLGFMQIPKGTVAGVYGYHRGWVGDTQRRQCGFQLDHGRTRHPAEAARARPRHPGVRPAQHAHRAALPAAEGLDRTRLHGPGHDLHRDAGHQCRTRRRGGAGPASSRWRTCRRSPAARRSSVRHVARVWLCPDPRDRPAPPYARPSPSTTLRQCRRTSSPFPADQSRSVATRRVPRARQAPRMVGAKRAKSSAVRNRSGSMVRGMPNGRRMSCWWTMPSVSAIRPPKPPVRP